MQLEEDGLWDQVVGRSDVAELSFVGQVQLLGGEIAQVRFRVLHAQDFGVQHLDGSGGVVGQVSVLFVLQFRGGNEDRLDSRADVFAGVVMGEFGHALQHSCWWVGAGQLEDGGATDFMGFSDVLVDLEQDAAGQFGVVVHEFVH